MVMLFSKSKTFSLVELLIVLSIFTILASLLQPSLMQALESTRNLTCKNHLKVHASSLSLYTEDNSHFYPYAADWSVGSGRITFDDLLGEYDGRNFTNDEMLRYVAPVRDENKMWACPEDSSIVGSQKLRRSYLISRGGRGLYRWPFPNGIAGPYGKSYQTQDVSIPSETIAMSELSISFWSNKQEAPRYLGYGYNTVLDNPLQQSGSVYALGTLTDNPIFFHAGKTFNYQFCDGHVESLIGEETIGAGTMTSPRGMWTRGVD